MYRSGICHAVRDAGSAGRSQLPPHEHGKSARSSLCCTERWPWRSGLVLSCQVPFDVVLAEQLVTGRVVLYVRLGRTPALSPRIDKQQEQTSSTQANARPGDEAAIKPVNTKGAVSGVTRRGSTDDHRRD